MLFWIWTGQFCPGCQWISVETGRAYELLFVLLSPFTLGLLPGGELFYPLEVFGASLDLISDMLALWTSRDCRLELIGKGPDLARL